MLQFNLFSKGIPALQNNFCDICVFSCAQELDMEAAEPILGARTQELEPVELEAGAMRADAGRRELGARSRELGAGSWESGLGLTKSRLVKQAGLIV